MIRNILIYFNILNNFKH